MKIFTGKPPQEFECKKLNQKLSWIDCMNNYVGANSVGLYRQPKPTDTWKDDCIECKIGQKIRETYSEQPNINDND